MRETNNFNTRMIYLRPFHQSGRLAHLSERRLGIRQPKPGCGALQFKKPGFGYSRIPSPIADILGKHYYRQEPLKKQALRAHQRQR